MTIPCSVRTTYRVGTPDQWVADPGTADVFAPSLAAARRVLAQEQAAYQMRGPNWRILWRDRDSFVAEYSVTPFNAARYMEVNVRVVRHDNRQP